MHFAKAMMVLCCVGASLPCAARDESRLDLVYVAGLPTEGVTTKASNCRVVLNTPVDIRKNRETLGTTFRDNPILSSRPVTEWLNEALTNLKQYGFSTSTAGTPGESGDDRINVSASLEKLYVWNHSLNLHSTLVVKTTLQAGNEPEIRKNYRVVGTKLNWANGDSEFVDTMNLTAMRFIEQLSDDLRAACKRDRS